MKLTLDLFEKSKNHREIITIHTYSEEKDFFCGYVIDCNEEFVIIQQFTPFGSNNGVAFIPINDIQRVDYNNDYCNAMQCMIDYGEAIFKPGKISIKISDSETPFVEQLKNFVGDTETILTLYCDEERKYKGYILEVEEEDFAMQCVDEMGEDLGIVLMRIHEIANISIDDLDNRRRSLLYKWRKATL